MFLAHCYLLKLLIANLFELIQQIFLLQCNKVIILMLFDLK